jgi:WD40 repeat protein
LLASGSGDTTIKMRTLNDQGSSVESVAFDSTYLLASGSYDRTVKLWNKQSRDLLRTLIGLIITDSNIKWIYLDFKIGLLLCC